MGQEQETADLLRNLEEELLQQVVTTGGVYGGKSSDLTGLSR
jgi:hypothetical protein